MSDDAKAHPGGWAFLPFEQLRVENYANSRSMSSRLLIFRFCDIGKDCLHCPELQWIVVGDRQECSFPVYRLHSRR